MRFQRTCGFILLPAFLCAFALTSFAADKLPDRISNEDFWKLLRALSEQGGTFQSENLLSNETDFPQVMTDLEDTVSPGGAYLGVGPEQNFNYIAVVRPKIVFIIDIRPGNLLEQLMYKALFEMSPDRATFVSRLFSRRLPVTLSDNLSAAELFEALSVAPMDQAMFQRNLKQLKDFFAAHGATLTADERAGMESVYSTFFEFGPLIHYNSRGGGGGPYMPTYQELMTAVDDSGQERSYLSSEERFRVVRDLESRNLVVPLVGDFGGPHAIRSVGRYLKDHEATVSAFYTSNVEGYLFQGGDRRGNPNGGAQQFYDNVATLPLNTSSQFIRWVPRADRVYGNGQSIVMAPIQRTIEDFKAGRFSATDLFPDGRFGFGRRSLVFSNNTGSRRTILLQASVWIERLRVVFYLSWSLCGFLIRYFLWRPADPWSFAALRRILHSLLWAAAGLCIAIGLGALAHI